DFCGDGGELGAFTAHNPTDERCQRGQVPGDGAGGLTRIPLYESVPYGTISAEVVTHRRVLLDWSRFPARVYDETTSNVSGHRGSEGAHLAKMGSEADHADLA